MNKKITYPIRINKYLSYKGYCSRRQGDRFVEEGKVFINGKPAELGQKVRQGDTVELADDVQSHTESYVYYVFNKPKGVVSTNPQRDEKSFRDFLDLPEDVAPVGRLDKESHGLLFLTNNGQIVNKMLNPKFDHEKEYAVTLNKEIKGNFKNRMENGVDIEGYTTKPAQVNITGDTTFNIILTEGKKHQIRRMVTALGYEVKDLKRTRIMNIKLRNIAPGEGRELTEKEREELLSSL